MPEELKNLTVPVENLYRVIGENKIGEYAAFFNSNEESLLQAQEEVLKEFCVQFSFTKEEFEHFKMGVATMALLFARCLEVVEEENEKGKKEEKKD